MLETLQKYSNFSDWNYIAQSSNQALKFINRLLLYYTRLLKHFDVHYTKLNDTIKIVSF